MSSFVARFRIGPCLICSFILLALIGGAIGLVGLFAASRINSLNDQLYDQELLGISYIKEANIGLIRASRARANYSLAQTRDERAAQKTTYDTEVRDLEEWLTAARPLLYSEEAQRVHAETDRTLIEWRSAADAFFNVASSRALETEDPELVQAQAQSRALNRLLDEQLTTLVKLKEGLAVASVDAATDTYEQVRWVIVAVSVFGLASGAILGWVTTVSVTRPLKVAVQAADRVATGDLTGAITLTTRDEVGDLMRALQAMNDNLRGIVGEVRSGCESIASASAQIAQGNTDLSRRTEDQASSLEQTAASMEELTPRSFR